MVRLTKTQMLEMGMTAEQIEAVSKTYEEQDAIKIAEFPKTQERRVVYQESDITSIGDIVKYTSGTIIRLPDFADGAPFIAKLKRPSMLQLMRTGKIPNSLITQATQLFKAGANALGKDNTIDDLFIIMEAICEEALVEPKYSELKAAGVILSDDQMMAIFSYTQQGVKALEQFR